MIPARSGACPSRWTARLAGGVLLGALIGDGLASVFSPLFVAPVPRAPVLPSKAELLEAGPPDHGLTTSPWVDMGAICAAPHGTCASAPSVAATTGPSSSGAPTLRGRVLARLTGGGI